MLRSRKAKFKVEALDEALDQRPADAERGPERMRQRSAAKELLWKGLEQIGTEHREILVAMEARDGETAQRLFMHHVGRTGEVVAAACASPRARRAV